MKKYRAVIAVVTLFATLAVSSTIHSWTTGDVLNSNDLNANFSHIHNLMVGGHGARLVNADVSASAAIAHTKLATPGLVAKAVVTVGSGTTPCGAGTCTQTEAIGAPFSSVVWNSAGDYTFTWTTARTNGTYAVLVTPLFFTAAAFGVCHPYTGLSTTAFTVKCVTIVGPATATNAVFNVVVYDLDN